MDVTVTHRDDAGTVVKTQEYTVPANGAQTIPDPEDEIGKWASVLLKSEGSVMAATAKMWKVRLQASVAFQLYKVLFGPSPQKDAPMRYPMALADGTWESTGYMVNNADTVRDGVYTFNNPSTGMAVDSNLVNDLGAWNVAELQRYGGSLDWYNLDVIQYDGSTPPYEYTAGASQLLMQRSAAAVASGQDTADDDELYGLMGYSNVPTGPYLAGVVPVASDIDKQTLYLGVASDNAFDNPITVQLFDAEGVEVWTEDYTLEGQARGIEIDLTPYTTDEDAECYSLLVTSRVSIGSTPDDIYGVLIWGCASGDQAATPLTAMSDLNLQEDEEQAYYIPLLEVTLPYAVTGQGQAIAPGDDTPSTEDGTDFGDPSDGGVTQRTFAIAAAETADGGEEITPTVALTNGTHFKILSQPSSFTAPGGSTEFTIGFNTDETGTFTDTVTINNGDDDDIPFTFTIQGTGPTSGGEHILIWQNRSNGKVVYWKLDGDCILENATQDDGWGFVSDSVTVNSAWKLVGIAKVNGMDTLIWQNRSSGKVVYWKLGDDYKLTNATQGSGWGFVSDSVTLDSLWNLVKISNIGEENTLIWQRQSNGKVAYWRLLDAEPKLKNETQDSGWGFVSDTSTLSSAWRLSDVADFDGEKNCIWQNQDSGKVAYWKLNDAAKLKDETQNSGWGFVWDSVTLGNAWRLGGMGDGSGENTCFWQNQNNGRVAYWKLNANAKLKNATQNNGWGFVADSLLMNSAWRMGCIIKGNSGDTLIWQNASTGKVVWWKVNDTGKLPDETQNSGWGYVSDNVTLNSNWLLSGVIEE